jgi:uncharacterized protein (DUF1684 family)
LTSFKAGSFLLIAGLAVAGLFYLEKNRQSMTQDPELIRTTDEFRKLAEERLRSPTGWLTVVGLHWLKESATSIGAAKENKIQLPLPVPDDLGEVLFSKDKVALHIITSQFTAADGSQQPVLVDDLPAKDNAEYPLNDDSDGDATQVKIGTVTFFVIKRKNGVALRVKDENSEARQKFQGRVWYPAKSQFVINATWTAHDENRTLMVPDILGNMNEEKSPGFATFEIDGEKVTLHPTIEKSSEGDKLFFVFRDQTSGKETYGAARFLYADMPKGEKVILDFNRAINPPCAFTNYATCPMPPRDNIIKVAIAAGEKTPAGH